MRWLPKNKPVVLGRAHERSGAACPEGRTLMFATPSKTVPAYYATKRPIITLESAGILENWWISGGGGQQMQNRAPLTRAVARPAPHSPENVL